MSAFFVPVSASTQAATTDRLFLLLLVLSGVILLLVFSLVAVFAVRYRRGSSAPRGAMPAILSREFEIGWTAATLFVFLFLFWWASSAQVAALIPPAGALEIHVVAKQWMWKTQHPEGPREINELHVPADTPVRLLMTSEDVIHSFFVPAFRIKKDVLPGRYTETWFQATKPGVYHLLCAEYCGTDHARMEGRVVVMPAQDYARWLGARPEADGLAREGARLFVSRGCAGCHAPGSRVRAPRLAGLFGSTVPLSDGRRAVVDEAYIRDSILQPERDIAAGYDPIMPSFRGVLGDGEIVALTAYIRSLAAPEGRPAAEAAAPPGLAPGPPEGRSPAMEPGRALEGTPPAGGSP
ncbi:cytochrome c oxidase subunit II [Alsobacter soli]|uniref:cytochrome-c oxidase n=1 Tax=Alsobacter soli TaxID=2109933 RepID=A0A2T1HY15_9HYPH|nr:cytochrome c oxidase subunit II [Alsobacter soli]PSC06480.1 cytochrome c oxidase subunit II [Alsobacter soli]